MSAPLLISANKLLVAGAAAPLGLAPAGGGGGGAGALGGARGAAGALGAAPPPYILAATSLASPPWWLMKSHGSVIKSFIYVVRANVTTTNTCEE